MSNEIKYGLICEDLPQRIFVEKILSAIVLKLNSSKVFVEEESFKRKFGGASVNRRTVERTFVDACLQANSKYNLDVCFVGIDLDDFQKKNFTNKQNELRNKLPEKLKDFAIIFIPVQCVEHWLWHIQLHHENPTSTKNEQIETQTRQQAKLQIHNSKKIIDKEKINTLLANVDLERLCSRSFSFNHFYELVKEYLKKVS